MLERKLKHGRRKHILFIFVLILVAGCGEQTKKAANSSMESLSSESQDVDSISYVFLDYKSEWQWIFQDGTPTNISERELVEIEEIIQKAVAENNEQQRKYLNERNKKYPENQRSKTGFEIKTEGYKRQYVAVLNNRGQKEVWINFFCDDWGNDDWKSDIMIVDDGGNCYFSLKVNLATKKYYELYINGYA